MTFKLVGWFVGSRDYLVPSENASAAADLIARSGANIRRMRMRGGMLAFTVALNDSDAVERILQSHGIECRRVRERGFRYLVYRYRRRLGIPIGAVLFFAVLWLSEQFIWTIDVAGNTSIPSHVIIERLDALGCGIGTYVPKLDFDRLHNGFLLKYDDIAWIAVNVRGTNATVEVRESEVPSRAPDEDTPYNLVASEDGVIEYMEILRGTPIASCEDLVRKGELLASGIEEGKHSLRLVHARGTVTAKVRRDILIEVPLESTRMEPTGNEYSEKYLNIFGTSIKFFANTGNMSSEYDKIEYEMLRRRNNLSFFDAVEVPIAVDEMIFREYSQVPVVYTEEQARAEAYRQLREECATVIGDGELTSREISAGLRDGVYVIECRLTVVKNIAEELPIYTSDDTEN